MKSATLKLKSRSPLTFGKFNDTPKLKGENPKDWEERTWKERAHYDENGMVYIPGVNFGNCFRDSAKFMSIQIPGKGKSTYTKHFDAGIIILDNIETGIHKDNLERSSQHVPSNGQPGGSSRVIKHFPIVKEWHGTIKVIIGDDIITEDVFKKVVENAGSLIGIGTWRPRNRGQNGRFDLVEMKWEDYRK